MSFTILEKQITQMLRFKAKITPNKTATKTAMKKCFLAIGLFYKFRKNCDSAKPYNKSLINLVCSVCTGKYCLRFLSHRPRSFVARSVRKPQAILSRTDRANEVNKSLIYLLTPGETALFFWPLDRPLSLSTAIRRGHKTRCFPQCQ